MVTKSGIRFRHASNKTAVWCKSIAEQAKFLWRHELIAGPVAVELEFRLPRLKTIKRPFPSSRYEGDLDKLIRGVLDALTGTVLIDDSQVIDLRASKRYTDGEAGCWVTVLDV